MDTAFTQVITSYGGLGVLALFAWLLLRSILKTQEGLQKEFIKQLALLLERQEKQDVLLSAMLESNKQHENSALDRHVKIVECLNVLNTTLSSSEEKVVAKCDRVIELTLEQRRS